MPKPKLVGFSLASVPISPALQRSSAMLSSAKYVEQCAATFRQGIEALQMTALSNATEAECEEVSSRVATAYASLTEAVRALKKVAP